MRLKHILYISSLSIFAASQAEAQSKTDSTIKEQSLNFYQEYKPEVVKPVKKVVVPKLPEPDTIYPTFNYVVPDQQLYYHYRSIPLRPLALGIDNEEERYDSYIAAGIGNIGSIFFDAGTAKINSENFQSAFHAKHLSQKQQNSLRQQANTEIAYNATYLLDKHDIIGGISFDRNAVVHYGGLGDTIVNDAHKDSLFHRYNNFDVHLGYANVVEESTKFTYAPKIKYGFYSDNRGALEHNIGVHIPMKYTFSEKTAFKFNASADFAQFENHVRSYWNNLVVLHPAFVYNGSALDLNIGVKPSFGKEGNFYFLPDLKAKVTILDNGFSIHGGLVGHINTNTFEALSSYNPYMLSDFQHRQTRQIKGYLGFDAGLGKHVSFGATVGYNNWKNFSQFINLYTPDSYGRNFGVVYDQEVRAYEIDAYFKYQLGEKVALTGTGQWNFFHHKTDFDKVFHNPKVKMGGIVSVKPMKNLSLNANLSFWDGMYAINHMGEIDKMAAFLDLGLKGEYQVIKQLSLFLQLNNILNNQYQRWNQYNVYGINVLGGLKFKF